MENDHPIQFWLKAIYDAIRNLGEKVGASNQADWNEEDTTSAAFVNNKPTIPTNLRITVSDIKGLTASQLESLECGDIVIKEDSSGKHAYTVSYKGTGGLCLTYTDCENVETVAYEKSGDTWSWDSTDVTHIAGE